MSTVDIARGLMAILQPLTGERATGFLNIQLQDQDMPGGLLLPRGTALCPVINGQIRPQMLFKLAANPLRADGAWEVGATGVIAAIHSNIGGVRYNLPASTSFVFEPPLAGLLSAISTGEMIDATSATGLDSVKDIVQFDDLDGPAISTDLAKSGVKQFPAIVVNLEGVQPADGSSVATTARGTRGGNGKFLYRFDYTLTIITSRMDKGQHRRDEGLAILDRVMSLINDRMMVDGCSVSSPGGVQVRNVTPGGGDQGIYQKFGLYHIEVSATSSIVTEDTRLWWPWLHAYMDVVVPTAAGTETSYTLVDEMIIEMDTVTLATDPDGDILVTET